jgi:hypothetical protein
LSVQARAAEASSLRSSISQLESQVTILEVTHHATHSDGVPHSNRFGLILKMDRIADGLIMIWVEWVWHVQEDKAGMQRDMETLQHKRTAAEERCDALAKQGTHISI